jgi:hypothetical protein
MNKVQTTYNFFVTINADGIPEFTGDFYGKPNLKIVIDMKRMKIKKITFHKENKMIENLRDFYGVFKGVDFSKRP